jgi:hypothetical protein
MKTFFPKVMKYPEEVTKSKQVLPLWARKQYYFAGLFCLTILEI